MNAEFSHSTFGNSGRTVCRLGLSGSYRPGKETIYKALDEGINFFFWDTRISGALWKSGSGNSARIISMSSFSSE